MVIPKTIHFQSSRFRSSLKNSCMIEMNKVNKQLNINEISQEFELTKDTLRYWEKIGLLPKIYRNQQGYRIYSDNDKNWIFLY